MTRQNVVATFDVRYSIVFGVKTERKAVRQYITLCDTDIFTTPLYTPPKSEITRKIHT